MRVEVQDFGPIIEGTVDLKPLTIFVGPNGSGKSYMAMLIYALFHSGPFNGGLGFDLPISRRYRRGLLRSYWTLIDDSDEIISDLEEWLVSNSFSPSELPSLPASSLPRRLLQALENASGGWLNMFGSSIERELSRCYGTESSSLSRRIPEESGFKVAVTHGTPDWKMNMQPEDASMKVSATPPQLRGTTLKVQQNTAALMAEFSNIRSREEGTEHLSSYILEDVSRQMYGELFQDFPATAYYLPAARSGILQSHKLLASAIVRRAPFAGIEPLLPSARLTGAVADFISGLLTMDPDEHLDLYPVAEFLEKDIAKGRIFTEDTPVGYPEIYYEIYGQQFLLHQTSSMVSELAPLVLYLKHSVESGDLLIIEEPESHLHPANQRKLAWAIVKLIRDGLNVMLTTHSDYFLSQLSNFVRLSLLADERVTAGYDAKAFIDPDDVGCYLFEWDEEGRGSRVRTLDINAEDGIPDDEFSDVAELLYNEYVDLERVRIGLL